jgi:subfamily B ATP-binding cassette protein MsbA
MQSQDVARSRVELPRAPALRRLLGYMRPYLGLLVLALFLALAHSGGRYLRAYLIKPLLDDVLVPHATGSAPEPELSWLPGAAFLPDAASSALPVPPRTLTREQGAALEARIVASFGRILAVAVVLVFAMPLLFFARSYVVEYALGRVDVDIKRQVCAKLLALPLRFHQEQRRGDVLSRTLRDVETAYGALSLVFGDFLHASVSILVGAGVLFFISWQLSLAFLLAGPALFAVMAYFGTRIRHSARRRQESFADVTQRLVEILAGIKVIKVFRAEVLEEAAFRRETRKLFRRSMKVVRQRLMARGLVETLNFSIGVAVLALGFELLLRGRFGLTPGDLAAFAAILGTTYQPTKELARGWTRLMDAVPSADRFFEVLDRPVELLDAPDAVRVSDVRHGVRLRDVTFGYGDEPVLRGVSLEIRAGEVVALVGRSGAGKTTLADLLLRLYDPLEGAIEIDGIDLRQVQRSSLLAQIAVVAQDPFLFDGTIRENIAYGRPGAREEEIRAAARVAHVEEFVSRLPLGYETEVGPIGTRLSGGQRQRITIARAIVKNPSILIFDEATSSLDSKSERYVQEAIEALLGGRRTVLMIAHRLSTLRLADRIAVLEGGRIVEEGSHEELLRKGGLYRELVELQGTGREPAPPG